VRIDEPSARVAVTGEPGDLHAELHPPAQLGEPLRQQFTGAPLRQHPGVRVGHVRAGVVPGVHAHVVQPPAGQVHAHARVVAPGLEHPVDQAEVVEDLQGARLQALAARAVEEPRAALDQPVLDAAPGQIAGQRQSGRSGSDDQHVRHDEPHFSESIFSESGVTVTAC
jgi:hypothetical protein